MANRLPAVGGCADDGVRHRHRAGAERADGDVPRPAVRRAVHRAGGHVPECRAVPAERL